MSLRFNEFRKPASGHPAAPVEVPVPERRAPRIAMYSHDTQGLGHIRRNLLISQALSRFGAPPIILLMSGLREATAFTMPSGVDCMTLPSLGKGVDGRYSPRLLDVPLADLMTVRSRAILAVLQSFEPDVLIVDKVPRGIFDELMPSLAALRSAGRTRVVLGLREILDDPAVVKREWEAAQYDEAIREHYDRIWIYGDPAVYDTAREYGLAAELSSMVRYTGYLNPLDGDVTASAARAIRKPDAEETGELTLCLVGGGQDGLPLAEAFLAADLRGAGILVTGPLMPAEARSALGRMAAGRPNIRVHEFVTDPCPLIAQADRVIAMGGYNTVCEILAYEKPALIVPRITPRIEQLIRATRLAERGLVDVLRPEVLDGASISKWIATSLRPRPRVRDAVDLGGVARLPQLLGEVLASPSRKEPMHAVS